MRQTSTSTFVATDDGEEGVIGVRKFAGDLEALTLLQRYAISDKSDFATKAYSDRGDDALRKEIEDGEKATSDSGSDRCWYC